MFFYIYLVFSLFLIIALILFIVYFGVTFFTGAPFAPSTPKKIKIMMSYISQNDIKKAADLGSGDGRIIIALAKQGIEAHGYEINPFMVWWSRIKIKKLGLEDKAFIHRKSIWDVDYSEFDCVVVFGILYMMDKLEKKLKNDLNKGTIVISNFFELPNWKYDKQIDGVLLYKIT